MCYVYIILCSKDWMNMVSYYLNSPTERIKKLIEIQIDRGTIALITSKGFSNVFFVSRPSGTLVTFKIPIFQRKFSFNMFQT